MIKKLRKGTKDMNRDLHIIDQLSLAQFKEDYKDVQDIDKYEVISALFLTYSLKPKVVLALLDCLFFELGHEERKSGTEIANAIYREMMTDEDDAVEMDKREQLKEKIAFLYQNGRGQDNPGLGDKLLEEYTYSVKRREGKANFHPKLYIVQYGIPNGKESEKEPEKVIYRIIIGSQNLSMGSGSLEHAVCIDIEGIQNNNNEDDSWVWLDSLIKPEEDEILSSYGLDYNTQELPLKNILEKIKKYKLKEKPEIITSNFDNNIPLQNEKVEIFSPFITKEKVECLKGNAEIYTMASELKKRGFVEDENGKYCFYCFMGKPEEYLHFSHCKIYKYNEYIYTGSLNFTGNAFKSNREIMVKLNEVPEILEELKKLYKLQKYSYVSNQNRNTSESIQELFENFVDEFFCGGRLSFVEDERKEMQLSFSWNKTSVCIPDIFMDYRIQIIPEGNWCQGEKMPMKDVDVPLQWKLPSKFDVAGCGIIFSLYNFNEEQMKAIYTLHFPFDEKFVDEIKDIAQAVQMIELVSIGVAGNLGEDEPENSIGRTLQLTNNIRKHLKMPSLEEVLSAENQNVVIEKCETRQNLLNTVIEKANGYVKKEQEDFCEKIGVQVNDLKKLQTVCLQNKKMLDKMKEIVRKGEGNNA